MLSATNKVAVHFKKEGRVTVLDLRDCVDVLNALVRTNQLELWIGDCDQLAEYSDCVLRFGYAFPCGEYRGDEVIALHCGSDGLIEGSFLEDEEDED